ncbi:aminopeptidase P family protein [Maritalea sp.]|jgi:Xaa-Pro aminopeptidase|uniref:aminopeptidase P family protein n=1 Tax=Maritalea sp. TaxID=2003361 RepID=UPI0039E2189A
MLKQFSVQKERLSAIRRVLKSNGLDGLIIPRFDAHMAEYIAPCDRRLQWATGFSGSAGVALITLDEAIIFVDGRYTVQVREQCPDDLFQYRHLHDEPLKDWFAQCQDRNKTFAFDPMHIPFDWHQAFKAAVKKSHNFLVSTEGNIIDQLWEDRPEPSEVLARPFGEAFCGEHSQSKRARIAKLLEQSGADMLVENQSDNIAWLLNIRGDDIAYNPFVNSFLTLDKTGEVTWFVDHQKVPQDRSAFELEGVNIRAPESFLTAVEQAATQGLKLSCDPAMLPVAVKFAAGDAETITLQPSPITLAKAQKNATELEGMRDCHIQDGVAWVQLAHWLQQNVVRRADAGNPITELETAAKIEQLRAETDTFEQLSFDVISGSGPNGAMCHYKVNAQSNRPIAANDIYLHDSGGQFTNGTTDATRTFVFEPPSREFCENYTAVLKGFIALANVRFPTKTYGHHLDAIARAPLWAMGKDYDHGTGHGVGHNLSVHEQPQRIGRAINEIELVPGMVISIEPGFYVAGEYGIRIENLFEVTKAKDGYLQFETLSMIPIAKAPIVGEMLTKDEINWLNNYHRLVEGKLADLVPPELKGYLAQATAQI